MYKKLAIVGLLSVGMSSAFAQSTDSTINKCSNGKDPIVYTEFDCPEGYDIVVDSWLSETNITSAEKFGDESKVREENVRDANERPVDQVLE
ncbi:MAG: hypothetical protein ACRCXK_04880 [Wohlfahrtiimonas sp.]